MNILLTTDAFPPGSGGSGRSTATLAAALARREHRVRVVVGRAAPRGQTDWEGIPVSEISMPKAALGSHARERAYSEGLGHALGDEAWDLVHAQHWLSAMASRAACPRLPMVVTIRDYWPVCIWSTMLTGTDACPGCSYTRRLVCVGRHRPLLWPLAPLLPPVLGAELARRQRALVEAKAVVAVSEFVRETLPLDTVHVVPNFVGALDVELPRPDDLPERFVLFVGKLEPNKAPDRLFPILEEARSEVPLVIAGSGSLSAELRDKAKGLRYEVRFLGWVSEERALQLMHHAAAVLFPSRWQEPLSRVLVDGLGVGAVLIVEPTGGSEDAVVHEESGLLGRNTRELGGALARVLSDDVLSDRLRRGAKARAYDRFSEAVVLPQIESVYRKAVTL
ncbi:MAG: glycosyltransferase family 4 protein [Acidobacteriota bacterium]|nr:MAG: glycosyltransferase family 4 protein [Acidobacteriota bacterium]